MLLRYPPLSAAASLWFHSAAWHGLRCPISCLGKLSYTAAAGNQSCCWKARSCREGFGLALALPQMWVSQVLAAGFVPTGAIIFGHMPAHGANVPIPLVQRSCRRRQSQRPPRDYLLLVLVIYAGVAAEPVPLVVAAEDTG